jgi:hypothetical protein
MNKCKLASTHPGSVMSSAVVDIEITSEESRELRAALAIVDKYKSLAVKTYGVKLSEADWNMIQYSVKNDRVLVEIKIGMCG